MRICELVGCNKELTRKTQKRFCSVECGHRNAINIQVIQRAQKKIENEKAKEHPCENCGKTTTNPKYCGRSCGAIINGSLYPKRSRVQVPVKQPKSSKPIAKESEQTETRYRGPAREGHPCFGCGVVTKNSKYCSNNCPRTLIFLERLRVAKEIGKLPSDYKMVKLMIAADRGFGCEICGITEWIGLPVMLILDHIDGNSDNHIWSNVRTTCSNCDAQLPTYKSKNKGNGSFRSRYMKDYYYETKRIKEQNTTE